MRKAKKKEKKTTNNWTILPVDCQIDPAGVVQVVYVHPLLQETATRAYLLQLPLPLSCRPLERA